ncbi:hypothetical protein GCM10027051_08310 [Niabella terrae]
MQIKVSLYIVLYGLFFLLLLQQPLQAQASRVKDSLRVEELLTEIKTLSPNDTSAYQEKVGQAAVLIRRNNFQLLTAALLLRMAIFNYNTYHYETAEKLTDQARAFLNTLEPSDQQALHLSRIAMIKAIFYGMRGAFEEEQKIYLELIPYYKKNNDSSSLTNLYYNLGNVFFNKNQYDKALHYFLESTNYKSLQGVPSVNYSSNTLGIAMTYNELKDTVHLSQYLDIARKELSLQPDSLEDWSMYYHLSGQNQILRKNYTQAIAFNRKGLQFAEKNRDSIYIINNIGGLATALYELGNYEEALDFLKIYYGYMRSGGNGHYTLVALRQMADINFKTGQPKLAYQFLDEYIQLSDSIKESQVTQQLHRLEQQFQAVQKENKIKALQYANERKDWKLNQNRIYLLGSVATILVLFALAFLLYRNSKNQKQLHQQDRQLHQHELSRLEQEHQIAMLSSLMQGAESERQRLGRDLHDGLGGLLSGIKLKLNSLMKSATTSNDGLQNEVRSDLDHAINEMRTVSQSLLPDMLQEYGLAEALKQFCARLSTDQLDIQFQAVRFTGLSDQQRELILYRVAQELINNAIKHAHAREILVQLQQRAAQIFLTVEDDGIGFDEVSQTRKGSGLTNLEHRIEYLKGTLERNTAPGQGCSVYITCPVTTDLQTGNTIIREASSK